MRFGIPVLGLTTMLFGGYGIVLHLQQQESVKKITEAEIKNAINSRSDVEECESLDQIHIDHVEYHDFIGDRRQEAVVIASTCMTGTDCPADQFRNQLFHNRPNEAKTWRKEALATVDWKIGRCVTQPEVIVRHRIRRITSRAIYSHSARSVTAGSTRIPARAGVRIATSATRVSSTGTAMNVNGS
jgi:hypothetical protein